jgi:hypothetical protein
MPKLTIEQWRLQQETKRGIAAQQKDELRNEQE